MVIKNDGKLQKIEQTLWKTADKLRNNMDASEYKHVVLGLIFLKYISDSFEELRGILTERMRNPDDELYWEGATADDIAQELEDRDHYLAANVFWVPPEARWQSIQNQAKQPDIGKTIDSAMLVIEKENPRLKGILNKEYGRERMKHVRLGELIDLIATIGFSDKEHRAKDVLGHVYEYFLGQFASAEGKKGGEFYTPKSIVNLIVEMLQPYKGRVFDPAMGSGGFFVSSALEIERRTDFGTILNALNVKSIPRLRLLDAGRLLSLFDQECYPMVKKRQDLLEESSKLGKIRDTLLPKLLSGEIRVDEAEQHVWSLQ